jgi:hypothetical protein
MRILDIKNNMKIDLGKNASFDLDILVDTRLLIQANSGGGKSWCIRRLLEQTHGKIQQIVIDLEGEFSTLREKYDYILAGKGGDTPAEPRSAALLAKRLLELNVSAIIDLYELEQGDRKRFVKLFIDALVDAPKNLWHPCLVIVDEAHVFCPEKGQSEAMGSIIDLATRGRKRGFCSVLATQRLSKLHKDAAAECNNKLIGRTGLDIDMKRASEELGFTTKEQYLSLRALDSGEFFAFGPAISSEVKKIIVGPVFTTHPKAGSRILTAAPVPPTQKIKSLLAKLGDIPHEAEEEAKTIDELKKQNADLRRKMTVQNSQISSNNIDLKLREEFDQYKKASQTTENIYKKKIQEWKDTFEVIIKMFNSNVEAITKIKMPENIIIPTLTFDKPLSDEVKVKQPDIFMHQIKKQVSILHDENDRSLGAGERKILTAIAQYTGITREHITVLTGYKRSSRDTYLQRLKQWGYIDIIGNEIQLSQLGISELGNDFQPLPVGAELRDHLLQTLPEGERKILSIIVNSYPGTIDRDIISVMSGYKRSSRDTYLQRLSVRKLIVFESRGMVKASDKLF